MVHVPLPHLQKSYRKSTVYGEIRCRQFTASWKSNETQHAHTQREDTKSTWIVFISGHGDTLDVWDTLMNQLYEKLILKPPDNGSSKINLIAYDRIGYGASSSFNAIHDNQVCITPPTFTAITAYDRAVELLSFLMNVETENGKFRLFQDELVLVAHSYGGLIAQSFLKVLTDDLHTYYPHISSGARLMNQRLIKLLLIDSSWIGMDAVVGKFEVSKIDCYRDYLCTLLNLQPPVMFYKYPSFERLKEVNRNYEKEIVGNMQICMYYRAYGDQLISQWSESLGFWKSMNVFGEDREQWTEWINALETEHGIRTKIVNLYSSAMNGVGCMSEVNQRWTDFQRSLSDVFDKECLLLNEEVESLHYIHLYQPQIVLDRLFLLIHE